MRGCLGVMVILEDGMEVWAPLSGQRVRLGGVFRQENFQRLVISDGGASGQLESDSHSSSGLWVHRPLLLYPPSSLLIFICIYRLCLFITLGSNHAIQGTYLRMILIILIL